MNSFSIPSPACTLTIPNGTCLVAAEGGVWDITEAAGRLVLSSTRPMGLAFLPPTMLLVCEPENHRVMCCDVFISSGKGSILAGTGEQGFTDGPVMAAMFHSPTHICLLEHRGCFLVSDPGNHAIRMITEGLDFVRTIVGNGVSGFVDGPMRQGRVRRPAGMHFLPDLQKVLLCDSGNHAVRCLDFNDHTISTVIGGTRGAGNVDGNIEIVQLHTPVSLTTSAVGVLICDKGNHAIRVLRQNRVHCLKMNYQAPTHITHRQGMIVVCDTASNCISVLDITDEMRYLPSSFTNSDFRTRQLNIRDYKRSAAFGIEESVVLTRAEVQSRREAYQRKQQRSDSNHNASKRYATTSAKESTAGQIRKPAGFHTRSRSTPVKTPVKKDAEAKVSNLNELHRVFLYYSKLRETPDTTVRGTNSQSRPLAPRISILQWWLLGVSTGLISSITVKSRHCGFTTRIAFEEAFHYVAQGLEHKLDYDGFKRALSVLSSPAPPNDLIYNYIFPQCFNPSVNIEVLCDSSVWALLDANNSMLVRLFDVGASRDVPPVSVQESVSSSSWKGTEQLHHSMGLEGALHLFKAIGVYPVFVTRATFCQIYAECAEPMDIPIRVSLPMKSCKKTIPTTRLCYLDFLHFIVRIAALAAPVSIHIADHLSFFLTLIEKSEMGPKLGPGGKTRFVKSKASPPKGTISLRAALRNLSQAFLQPLPSHEARMSHGNVSNVIPIYRDDEFDDCDDGLPRPFPPGVVPATQGNLKKSDPLSSYLSEGGTGNKMQGWSLSSIPQAWEQAGASVQEIVRTPIIGTGTNSGIPDSPSIIVRDTTGDSAHKLPPHHKDISEEEAAPQTFAGIEEVMAKGTLPEKLAEGNTKGKTEPEADVRAEGKKKQISAEKVHSGKKVTENAQKQTEADTRAEGKKKQIAADNVHTGKKIAENVQKQTAAVVRTVAEKKKVAVEKKIVVENKATSEKSEAEKKAPDKIVISKKAEVEHMTSSATEKRIDGGVQAAISLNVTPTSPPPRQPSLATSVNKANLAAALAALNLSDDTPTPKKSPNKRAVEPDDEMSLGDMLTSLGVGLPKKNTPTIAEPPALTPQRQHELDDDDIDLDGSSQSESEKTRLEGAEAS